MAERIPSAEHIPIKENSWLFIPFYSNPASTNYEVAVDKFEGFLVNAKKVIGLKLMVVDDGCGLKPERFQKVADSLVTIPENKGKAYAVREGLRNLLDNPNLNTGFIVQYDGDGDQSFVDVPVVHSRLKEVSDGNPNIPALVIGDRYSEKLVTPPNPDSVPYRQTILMFFGAIARELGFDDVRDWVSGARGYTKGYARKFLENSKSSRYGLEAEQLVVASLVGARVTTAPLTESRPRDPHTLISKWLQNFEVYINHEKALREQGKDRLVDLIKSLVAHLRAEEDVFDLDLALIGEDTRMHFTRLGDRYTAEIPREYRARLFVEDKFPFTIRKTLSPYVTQNSL